MTELEQQLLSAFENLQSQHEKQHKDFAIAFKSLEKMFVTTSRERGTKKPSDQLERASKYLEHSASAVGKAIHTEKSIIKQRDKGRGFTL
ncbi:MbeD/MobD family mobilization/exclusion protein [Photobacterium leiognathi subsp. mandapamensis]